MSFRSPLPASEQECRLFGAVPWGIDMSDGMGSSVRGGMAGMVNNHVLRNAKLYGQIPDVQPLPDLIEMQLRSYHQFVESTLGGLFREISPIRRFNGNQELHFDSYRFEVPKH